MLHLDFSDFSLIEQLVIPELAGITRATVNENIAMIFSQFCKDSQSFRELLSIPVNVNSSQYDLYSPHDGAVIIGIFHVDHDGVELKKGDYIQRSFSVIELIENPNAGDLKVGVVLKTLPTYQAGPTAIIDRYSDVLASGVKARLMLMPDKPWSNPQLGGYYQDLYDRGLLEANADVRNEFSVTRSNRSPRKPSYYW